MFNEDPEAAELSRREHTGLLTWGESGEGQLLGMVLLGMVTENHVAGIRSRVLYRDDDSCDDPAAC